MQCRILKTIIHDETIRAMANGTKRGFRAISANPCRGGGREQERFVPDVARLMHAQIYEDRPLFTPAMAAT
ncbi:hypothetical protein AA103581_0838 [Gluconobacter wancherniae NBRC 103581]|nr:hypothetical protein AA103581_0838 [Gluconobacter wancherniae NBRC 103581]